jgi:hypothetical protein
MRSARVVSNVIRMILGCDEMGGAGAGTPRALAVNQTVSQTMHAKRRVMGAGKIIILPRPVERISP